MSRPEVCQRGHNNWVITDPVRGWRRCRTCHNDRRPKKAPAFGIGADGKKFAGSRGTSQEDTWSRTELLRFRGYDI